MKVISIKPSIDQKNIIVKLSGNKALKLTPNLLLEYKLNVGSVMNSAEFMVLKKNVKKERVLSNAINYASRRAKTKKQLKEYLNKKDISSTQSEEIISKLIELGLIDDYRYIESFVNTQNLKAPLSRLELKYKLIKKGISSKLIEQYLLDYPLDERLAIKRMIAIKSKQTRYQQKDKLLAYLVRKGYSYSEIKSALEEN